MTHAAAIGRVHQGSFIGSKASESGVRASGPTPSRKASSSACSGVISPREARSKMSSRGLNARGSGGGGGGLKSGTQNSQKRRIRLWHVRLWWTNLAFLSRDDHSRSTRGPGESHL